MAVRLLNSEAEAEDAVQEVMLKLWNQRKKLANHPNVNGYVFLTARNYCLDQLKKKSVFVDSSSQQKLVADYFIETAENSAEGLFDYVRKLLFLLPKKEKEILLLRDFDGLEFDEIAELTQLNKEHIHVLLSRARKEIRIALQKSNYHE
ncbi:MAG: RNA polymerase sigma factor [Bacteroidales bacterium]|nr:RNA polymerase sigma factor [Bacteroidales bacterium]